MLIFNSHLAIHMLQIAIHLSVYMFFTINTFKSKLRYSLGKSIIMAVLYSLFSAAVILLFIEDTAILSQFKWFAIIVWTLCSALIALRCSTCGIMPLLFFVFAIFEIAFNVTLVSREIALLLPAIGSYPDITFLHVSIVVLLLITPLMWYLFVSLFKKVIDAEASSAAWKMLFVLPASFFMYCLLNSYFYNPAQGVSSWKALLILLILNFCVFLSYVAILQMLLRAQDSLTAKEKANNADWQLLLQREQYAKLADSVEKAAHFRHDMRHHFITINGYVDSDNLCGLKEYLNAYAVQNPPDDFILCENHSVDMVLRHYIALAKSTGIEVDLCVQIPKRFALPDPELCVIFGNLLENAIESCMRQEDTMKFINIKAKPLSENMLAINITNSYSGTIAVQDSRFLSSKHDGLGIGTASVIDIAERCGGSCKFTYDNNVFKAYVLLIG